MKNLKVIVFALIISLSAGSYAQQTVMQLKVISYNIWNGFDWGKDLERKADMIDWIKAQNPDVLALEELCGYTQEKLEQDAKKWGHNYALILKSNGYPVGITSNRPIQLKEKILKGLHHGALHCQIDGIDFFVVHLSPSDWKHRLREASIIKGVIDSVKQSNDKYVLMGDFNAHSPFDSELYKQNPELVKKYRKGDDNNASKNKSNRNLDDGELDYSVISTFLSTPLIDITERYVSLQHRRTFPSPAILGIWQTAGGIMRTPERLDYFFTSPLMSKYCKSVRVHNSEENDLLSDHYPIEAVFQMK